MHKIKQQILSKLDKTVLEAEMHRLGCEIFNNYERKPGGRLSIMTIQEALDAQSDFIISINRKRITDGMPYVDLTSWELLEKDELLVVYDIEANCGRLFTAKELDEYIGSADASSLTPATIRRWYANRKADGEYLVSDYDGVNFWIVE